MEPLAPMFTLDAEGEVTVEFPDFPRHTVLRSADIERLANALWKIASEAPGIGEHLRNRGLKRTRRLYQVQPAWTDSLPRMRIESIPGTDPTEPRVLWAAYSTLHAGWCVWRGVQGAVDSVLVAGPFKTRDEADALLGPALPTALPHPGEDPPA